MVINNIYLENFRNYEKQEIKLKNGINVFYGNNAQGKTNLLEAIFICSIGKSFRTNKDKELISFNSKKTIITTSYEKSDRSGKISLELDNKKRFLLNEIPLKRTSDVLGNIYVVLFTPDDISILKDSPSYRRRFLNIMISQLRPNYIKTLSMYNKTMEQRNSYLRQIKLENNSDNLKRISHYDSLYKNAKDKKEAYFYPSSSSTLKNSLKYINSIVPYNQISKNLFDDQKNYLTSLTKEINDSLTNINNLNENNEQFQEEITNKENQITLNQKEIQNLKINVRTKSTRCSQEKKRKEKEAKDIISSNKNKIYPKKIKNREKTKIKFPPN